MSTPKITRKITNFDGTFLCGVSADEITRIDLLTLFYLQEDTTSLELLDIESSKLLESQVLSSDQFDQRVIQLMIASIALMSISVSALINLLVDEFSYKWIFTVIAAAIPSFTSAMFFAQILMPGRKTTLLGGIYDRALLPDIDGYTPQAVLRSWILSCREYKIGKNQMLTTKRSEKAALATMLLFSATPMALLVYLIIEAWEHLSSGKMIIL